MPIQNNKQKESLRELRDIKKLSFRKIGEKLGISGSRAHQIYCDGEDRVICSHAPPHVAYEYQFPNVSSPGYKISCSECGELIMWVNKRIIESLGIEIIKEER